MGNIDLLESTALDFKRGISGQERSPFLELGVLERVALDALNEVDSFLWVMMGKA